MSKAKYKYNPNTLSYDQVTLTWKDHLKKVSFHLITGVVFTVIILLLSFNWIKEQGVKEGVLENEKTMLSLNAYLERLNSIEEFAQEMQERDDNIYRVIFGADPYDASKRELGTGGNPQLYKDLENLDHGDLAKQIAIKVAGLEKQLVAQSYSFDEVIELAKNKEKMLQSIPSIQPISNKDLTHIASGFGMRMHPVLKIMRMHAGIDFTADIGTDIFATGDGVIEKAEWMNGYGNIVIIDHGFGYKSRYAHCSEYKCKVGQKIKRGDVIALVGNTGLSSGPHVHYEVHFKGNAVNPVNYFFNDLSAEEYEKVIEISSQPTQSL